MVWRRCLKKNVRTWEGRKKVTDRGRGRGSDRDRQHEGGREGERERLRERERERERERGSERWWRASPSGVAVTTRL